MASKIQAGWVAIVVAGALATPVVARQATQALDGSRPGAPTPPSAAPGPTDPTHGAVIAARDRIVVKTLNEPEFSVEAIVDVDGTFQFGQLGHLKAAGLTARQLEADLKSRLNPNWVINPQVTVDVFPTASKRVLVNGSVRNPSPYPFAGRYTVMDALLAAGSVTEASGDRAFLIRGNADGSLPAAEDLANAPKMYIDLRKLLDDGDLSENYTLGDGDYLYVEKAQPFTINGEVKGPGQYAARRGLTVQQAIAIAGGLTDKASKKGITILRPTADPKKPQEIKVQDDKDFQTLQVKPGDTLTVHARIM
jgi:polysaccharide export outer membrane protein